MIHAKSTYQMTDGYLYCFSNKSMVGILKIGMSERQPDETIEEFNSAPDTWKLPTPYEIEFAKKVCNPKQKENTIHAHLLNKKINHNFFNVCVDDVKLLFDLMDGELWIAASTNKKSCSKHISRNLSKYFTEAQRIRSKIRNDNVWIGTYNSSQNVIICNKEIYKSLSGFAMAHHNSSGRKKASLNGWDYCECEVNGKWISTSKIHHL